MFSQILLALTLPQGVYSNNCKIKISNLLGFKLLYSKLILNFKYFVMRLSHRDLRKLEKRCLYDDCTSRKIVDC